MLAIINLVLLALLICMTAGLVKLAAYLLGRVQLSWTHAALFAALLIVLTVVKKGIEASLMIDVPPIAMFLLSFMLTLALGGWYFKGRATVASGAQVGVRGALQLTALFLGISLAICVPLFMLLGWWHIPA